MGCDVRLAAAVRRIEENLLIWAPYAYKTGDRTVEYWIMKDENNEKIVVVLPEQHLNEEDMEIMCRVLHDQTYVEQILYTSEKRYSLGRGVIIKSLPA